MGRSDDRTLRDARVDNGLNPYVLIVRGPDGRPRLERFDSAAAYRARLITLEQSTLGSISIDEMAGLLDAI